MLEVLPEPVSAVDQDTGIAAPLYYSAAGEQRHLIDVQRDAGHITVAAPLLAAAPTLPVTIVLKVFLILSYIIILKKFVQKIPISYQLATRIPKVYSTLTYAIFASSILGALSVWLGCYIVVCKLVLRIT